MKPGPLGAALGLRSLTVLQLLSCTATKKKNPQHGTLEVITARPACGPLFSSIVQPYEREL